jgi:hypothetical protein
MLVQTSAPIYHRSRAELCTMSTIFVTSLLRQGPCGLLANSRHLFDKIHSPALIHTPAAHTNNALGPRPPTGADHPKLLRRATS